VTRLKIWHDSSGLGPAWHLAQVTVHSTARGVLWTYPCHAWLQCSSAEPSGNVRELLEGVAAGGDVSYTVRVVTSDVRGAGTDGDVSISILGAEGSTGARFSLNTDNYRSIPNGRPSNA
jgi:lipoxygenase homology domain-containing protein 1